ncbi:MAG: hypothetical protein GTO45_18705 [Candidatus Aminicenantes bacterium]|nr:hypothetical protein [Candidatus Aminicenantes bacterium]NIM80819.1 hypothetical protein [Candidatus Aminicenantes bacterium]NIN20203.1 hypothetical protein [Candidatus Aminicenantes bacterium]NIN43982.1 hypothetical protein [Candidatus Aminicenantes bacterium]NIN86791.1 hypothetical protein [Candidatus Aminicenantes bacterium]
MKKWLSPFRLFILSLILFTAAAAPSSLLPKNRDVYRDQEHEKIIEKVEVINIETPVRVFYKNKSVKDLKKSDFKLFIDGEEREINGFYQVRKKLDRLPSPYADQPPRLFVLIFNISSTSSDLQKGMETFFKQVIRPNDRIMVLTNNVFLNERVVEDPQKEREKIVKIVDMETRRIWHKLIFIESNLKYIASTLKNEVENPFSPASLERAIRQFLQDYQGYFTEFRDFFFNPPEEQYVKVAKYLQQRQVEKWIFHFYEIPMFPKLKIIDGTLYYAIEGFFKSKRMLNPYVFDIMLNMERPSDLDFVKHIGKIFLNTGATFHTLLLHNKPPKFFEDYNYQAVSTDSQHIFRQVTRLTHGKVMASNNMEKFVNVVSAQEDVYYMLTYVPKKSSKKGKSKIEVTVTNKKYPKVRIVYDNQYRAPYFRKIVQKVKEEIPQIRIRQLEIKNGILSARISGIQLAPGDKEGNNRGKILLRVKLLNEKAILVSSTQKAFKTRAAEVPIRLRVPGFKAGNYQVFFKVTDLNSGSNDLFIEDLNITNDHVSEPGQEAFQF